MAGELTGESPAGLPRAAGHRGQKAREQAERLRVGRGLARPLVPSVGRAQHCSAAEDCLQGPAPGSERRARKGPFGEERPRAALTGEPRFYFYF